MTKTTFFKTMLLTFVIMVGSANVSSQVLYEDFNYTVGQNIGGSTNTTGGPVNNWYTHSNSQVGTIDVTSGSLNYTGLQTSTGNKVRLPGSNSTVPRDVNRALTGITGNSAYYSVLINIADNTQLSSTGDYFMCFGATSGLTVTLLGGRLGAKSVNTGANYRIVIQNNSTGTPTFTEFATDLSFGTTYLVVVKYDKSTSPTTAYVWVNPSSLGGTEPAGYVQNNSGTATTFTSFSSICLRNSSTTPKVDIDEIRVGTTWASVTPASSGPLIPVISAASLTGTVGTAFSYNISATYSPTSYALANSTTLPAGLSLNTTTGAITGTPTAVGSFSADFTATNAAGTSTEATLSFTIAKGSQTITFGALPSKYTNDADFSLTGIASSGLTLSYTSSNTAVATVTGSLVHIVGVGTTTITALQGGDANYNAASSVLQTLSVTNQALTQQSINFGALSAVTYGVAAFDLTASASSGLTVSYASSNTAVAIVSGATITIVGVGSTNITASQAGNESYNPASNVIQALTVGPKALTLPDAAATSKAYDGTNAAVITGTLTGIINSDNVTLTGTGTFADVNVADGIAVTSTSTLGGTKAANYTLTQPTGLTANITKANQIITFGAISTKNTSSADFSPYATSASSSVNPITYTSSNTAVATIVSGNIHIVGAGSTNITASQSASANYNAATDVVQTLNVNANSVPNVIITQVYGGGGNTGATYINDFIELYNTTPANIDISGWSVQYYAATGTSASVYAFPTNTIIPANNHFLIQCGSGGSVGTALPTADASCSLNMSTTAGKVVLYNVSTAQTLADATTLTSVTGKAAYVDYVPYGSTSTPVFGSFTVNLSATTAAIRKYSAGFVYTSNIGNDFSVATPNPRNSSIATQLIYPVLTFTVSASDGVIRFTAESGRTIELYNAVGQKLLIKQTVDGLNSIPVSAKGLVVLKMGNQITKVVL